MLHWLWRLLGYKEQTVSTADQEHALLDDARRRMASALSERRQDVHTCIAQREAERQNRHSTADSAATER